jgi:Ankyrin repeats (3 copies)
MADNGNIYDSHIIRSKNISSQIVFLLSLASHQSKGHRLATKICPSTAAPESHYSQCAANYWPDHARALEDVQQPELGLILRLFALEPGKITNDSLPAPPALRSCCLNWLAWADSNGHRGGPFPPAWYYSSLLGLLSFTDRLFQHGAKLRNTREQYTTWGGTVLDGGTYGTALQAASANGHVSIVRYLLENNLAQVNETSELGFFDTPLEAAASGGHLSVVQMLVENGVVIVARGRRDRVYPPLNAAIWHGHVHVVQYLLDHRADVDGTTWRGETTLETAIFHTRDMEIVRLLLQRGVDIELQGEYGNALQTASLSQSTEMISLLPRAGAKITAEAGYYGDA